MNRCGAILGLACFHALVGGTAVAAAATSETVRYFADFLPTAMALCGDQYAGPADGQNVLPALLGQQQDLKQRFLYWERAGGQAVRRGNWKAVHDSPGGAWELYDLASDPGEEHDVASSHPEIMAAVASFVREARTPNPHYPEPRKEGAQ